MGANKIICFGSRQDVDGIDGKASLQLEVCCKGAGEEFQEMRQGLQLVYNIINISSNPERIDWRVDEEEYNKNKFLSFCKKKDGWWKELIGILFCSLISPKEEKAEKLKLKKAIEKGNMEVKLSMVLILMM